MFAFLHIRSFSQLSNAHDAQNIHGADTQQLRQRLVQLTNAVKINSKKLDALEQKETVEKTISSGINPPKALTESNPVLTTTTTRFAGNRFDRMHVALKTPKIDTTKSSVSPNNNSKNKDRASGESSDAPKSAPVLPTSMSVGYKNHPILTLTDEQLRHEYTVSDMMGWYGDHHIHPSSISHPCYPPNPRLLTVVYLYRCVYLSWCIGE